MIKAYNEFVDFIAAGSTPESVMNFQPSQATCEHVAELIRREKSSMLSSEEAVELEHFLQLEHILRLAKAKARMLVE
jgi:hypothetical protein